MRKWLEYSLDVKKKKFNNQFLYSNFLLQKDKLYLDKMFNFKKFKKNRLFFTHYKFFKNKVKNNTIFLCSGYGFYEYFLKKKFKNFFISDVNINYKKFNFKASDYPNSISYYNNCLTLPLYYDLSFKEQKYLIDQLYNIIE